MKSTVKFFLVSGVIVLSACDAAHPTGRVFDTPSNEVLTAIEHIEDNVVLPNTMSLEPLNKELFKRYYALEGSFDEGVIKGIYIRMRDYNKGHTDYREKARVDEYDNVFYLPIEHLPLVM